MDREGMSMLQQKAGVDNSQGVTKLAQEIAEKLAELKSFVDNSPATTDKDRAEMDNVMQSFVSVIEKQLGSAPGEDQEEEPEMMNQVPMQAGMKGMPMGPQTRQ